MKRAQPRRVWLAARQKVEAEGACRICGAVENLEAAHILGRGHDRKNLAGEPRDQLTLVVAPERIVPLGGDFGCGCHGRYDRHELDLLPYLTLSEELQAVRDAGGLELARRRLAPTAYKFGLAA